MNILVFWVLWSDFFPVIVYNSGTLRDWLLSLHLMRDQALVQYDFAQIWSPDFTQNPPHHAQ